MGRKEQYLVRNDKGRMSTIMAQSVRGALDAFIRTYRPARGEFVSIKPRGHGNWQDYKIS